MHVYDLTVQKAQTDDREEYYIFASGKVSAWLSADIARGPTSKCRLALNAQGLILTGPNVNQELTVKIDKASKYEGGRPGARTGWNGPAILLANGESITPKGEVKPDIIYSPQHGYMTRSGDLEGWQNAVSGFADQPLILFQLLLPLMPPIRALLRMPEDLIIELVASPRTELAIPGALIGSVTGGTSLEPYHYWPFFTAIRTPKCSDPLVDQLVVLYDADIVLADKSRPNRLNDIRAILSHEVRSEGDPRVRPRVTLIVGRKRIAELAGEDTDIGRLAIERVLTLLVAPQREFGFFDSLPPGCSSVVELHRQVLEAVRTNRGVLYRRYLERLVQERHDDEPKLERQIHAFAASFRKKARIDENDAGAVRVGTAFGLVYAAGRLAQLWRLLPKDWSIGPVLLECYESFYEQPPQPRTFDEELEQIVDAAETLHIGVGQPPASADEIARAEVIVHHQAKCEELLLRPKAAKRLLPYLKQRKNDPQVAARLQREGVAEHYGVRRTPTGKERVICFLLALRKEVDNIKH